MREQEDRLFPTRPAKPRDKIAVLRLAIALAATVVLPLEPVVLMLMSCSKMSRAR